VINIHDITREDVLGLMTTNEQQSERLETEEFTS
jgi:hypothetical protein